MENGHSGETLVRRTSRWLYTRIADERAVWAEQNGTPMPPWDDVDELNKGYWDQHAEEMLSAVGINYRGE